MPIPPLTEPFPSRDKIVKPDGKASDVFIRYNEETLIARLAATPVLPDPVVEIENVNTTQTGTFGGVQSGGLYQIAAYLECRVADGAGAPTAVLTLNWTHNGKALSRSYTALSGSSTTNTRGEVDVLQIDGGTSVSYTIAYTAGGTPGLFRFDASLALTLMQAIEE